MNDSFTEEMIPVRFTFQADRAHEFLDDGRLVTQMEFETVDEIIEVTNEFRDALVDANAIINGKVVSLADFSEEV